MRLGVVSPTAALAFDKCIRAVQLYESLSARAGEAMQTVDILRDDAAKFTCAFESGDRVMHTVRLRVAERVTSLELVIPVLDPRRFGRHEILEVNRLASRPDALWPTEVWNSAAGGNAGAGEDQRIVRSPEVISQVSQVHVLSCHCVRHRSSWFTGATPP